MIGQSYLILHGNKCTRWKSNWKKAGKVIDKKVENPLEKRWKSNLKKWCRHCPRPFQNLFNSGECTTPFFPMAFVQWLFHLFSNSLFPLAFVPMTFPPFSNHNNCKNMWINGWIENSYNHLLLNMIGQSIFTICN